MDEYNEQLQNIHRENDRLEALVSSLQQSLDEAQFEIERLKLENLEQKRELSNRSQSAAISLPDLQSVRDKRSLLAARDRILKSLITGRSKVASTSPQYKTAAKVLDKFIEEVQKSTPVSIPAPSDITSDVSG